MTLKSTRPVVFASLVVAAMALGACGNEPEHIATVETVPPEESPASEGGTEVVPEVEAGATTLVSIEDGVIGLVSPLAPGPTVFTVANNGTMLHSFVVVGTGVNRELEQNLGPKETGSLQVDLLPGTTYDVYCPVLDHREKGEALELKTAEASAPTTAG